MVAAPKAFIDPDSIRHRRGRWCIRVQSDPRRVPARSSDGLALRRRGGLGSGLTHKDARADPSRRMRRTPIPTSRAISWLTASSPTRSRRLPARPGTRAWWQERASTCDDCGPRAYGPRPPSGTRRKRRRSDALSDDQRWGAPMHRTIGDHGHSRKVPCKLHRSGCDRPTAFGDCFAAQLVRRGARSPTIVRCARPAESRDHPHAGHKTIAGRAWSNSPSSCRPVFLLLPRRRLRTAPVHLHPAEQYGARSRGVRRVQSEDGRRDPDHCGPA